MTADGLKVKVDVCEYILFCFCHFTRVYWSEKKKEKEEEEEEGCKPVHTVAEFLPACKEEKCCNTVLTIPFNQSGMV